MTPNWLITQEKVQKVIDTIIRVGNPKKLIIFGSWVKGQVHRDSDLDIIVVADNSIENTLDETNRLRAAVDDVVMLMDIIVVRERDFEKFKDTPGLIYRVALKEGRLMYEAA